MAIDNRIVIRKVRLVFSFQKDASGDVLFLVNIAAEIFLIVPRAQHRIADVKILCIGVLGVSFGGTCFCAGYTVDQINLFSLQASFSCKVVIYSKEIIIHLSKQKGAVNMPLLNERIYTIEDIYSLPEGERAELLDGRIYSMSPPSTRHQILTGELYAIIRNYIREKSGQCRPYIAPFAVFLDEDEKNYVEPDVSVICSSDKVNDKGCHGAPDWIIEIASPATQNRDYGIKLFKYRTAGVREYWIVNPMKEIVNVYDFEKEIQNGLYSFDDEIPVAIYPGFSIRISDLLE